MLKTFKLFKLERWPDPPPRIPPGVRHLELMACPGLTSTTCFEHLSQLEVLRLGLCPDLVHLSLSHFPSLTDLSLVDLAISNLDDLNRAPRLQSAYLSSLSQLVRIGGRRHQQRTLQKLSICRCGTLRDISGLANLTGLQTLVFDRLPELNDLSALAGLHQLSELVLDDCPRLTRIAPLVRLPALHSVKIARCPAIVDLELWAARRDITLDFS